MRNSMMMKIKVKKKKTFKFSQKITNHIVENTSPLFCLLHNNNDKMSSSEIIVYCIGQTIDVTRIDKMVNRWQRG